MSKIIIEKVNFFKNRIINGDFSVWQRGESFTFTSERTYTADRMFTSNTGAGGVFTVTRSSINTKNSIKFTVNVPPTDLTRFRHWYGLKYKFEGQHLFDLVVDKKHITISFLFKSNVTGEFPVTLTNETYAGQTSNYDATQLDCYVSTFQYTTPDIAQKVEITIPLDTTWTYQPVNDNKLGFTLIIAFLNQGDYVTPATNTWINGADYATTATAVNWASASGNYIEIAELQVEEGQVATEFEQIPYDIQLIRCMRYYETGRIFGYNYAPAAANLRLSKITFKVQKRVVAGVGWSIDASSSNITDIWAYDQSDTSFGLYCTVSSGGDCYLDGTWTANAEF